MRPRVAVAAEAAAAVTVTPGVPAGVAAAAAAAAVRASTDWLRVRRVAMELQQCKCGTRHYGAQRKASNAKHKTKKKNKPRTRPTRKAPISTKPWPTPKTTTKDCCRTALTRHGVAHHKAAQRPHHNAIGCGQVCSGAAPWTREPSCEARERLSGPASVVACLEGVRTRRPAPNPSTTRTTTDTPTHTVVQSPAEGSRTLVHC